jgi:hypothetical protein
MEANMEKKKFRFLDAFSFAFKFAFRFPRFVLLPVFAYMLIALPLIYFDLQLFASDPFDLFKAMIGLLILYGLMIFIVFAQFFLFAGYVQMVSKWYQQKIEPVWKDYTVWDFPLFGKYLAVSLIYGVLVEIGTILLIIPGFVMMTIYLFCEFVLIDRHGGVRRAFSRSNEIVSGVKWKTLIFSLVTGIIFSGPMIYLIIQYFLFHQVKLFVPIMLVSVVTIFLNFVILQLTYCYLYKDLSAQQDTIDKIMIGKNDTCQHESTAPSL